MADVIETTVTPVPTENPQDKKGDKPGATVETTFTQADLDRVAGNTRKEARQAAINELLKELGLDNTEALKATVTDAQKRKQDEMTEAQKLQERIDKLTQERDNAAQRAQEVEAARIADKVNGKLEALATKARVEHPEDVVKFLRDNHSDDVKALIGEDGKIDDKAAERLLEVVKKARPNWFAVSGLGSPSNRDGRPPQPSNAVVLKQKARF